MNSSNSGLSGNPISEKRSRVLWQSKDKHKYCVVNAKDEFWIECPGPLDQEELRSLRDSINAYLKIASLDARLCSD